MDKSRQIYISSNGKLYKFLSYVLQDADGSFYIAIERSGTNKKYIEFDSRDYQLKPITLEKDENKRIQMSYHASGCVRYHNVSQSSNYFEPIIGITQPNIIAGLIIPNIKKLDISDKSPTDDDFVIQIAQPTESKIQFTFIIAPWNMLINATNVAVRYKGMFSFIIQMTMPEISIKSELENHFIFMTLNRGLFERQIIDKDNALIQFHQKINKSKNAIIYSPNNEGVWKIICAVPMRIPPNLFVKFVDDSYSFEVVSKTESIVKFKVKEKHNNTIKEEVAISEIILDARL